jgi:hypothetical protein
VKERFDGSSDYEEIPSTLRNAVFGQRIWLAKPLISTGLVANLLSRAAWIALRKLRPDWYY